MGKLYDIPIPTARTCKVGVLISTEFDDEDAEALAGRFKTGQGNEPIAELLTELYGFPIGKESVRKHRQGRCDCG
jgi:hypothetical protein